MDRKLGGMMNRNYQLFEIRAFIHDFAQQGNSESNILISISSFERRHVNQR